MVRAILDGKKTVTRRVMKPANTFRNRDGYRQGDGLWIDGYGKYDKPNGHIKDYSVSSCWMTKKYYIEKYAPYQPEDILYVRETFQKFPCYRIGEYPTQGNSDRKPDSWDYVYKTDNWNPDEKWIPSIHMPKEAARIWLKVTDVRVEKLQDITNEQIIKEGISKDTVVHYLSQFPEKEAWERAAHLIPFTELWNGTIKKQDIGLYDWDANPWVWVIEFEQREKPEEN